MINFFKRYWPNILILVTLVLLLFFFIPNEENRYLPPEFDSIEKKSRSVLVWTDLILSVSLFIWLISRLKKISTLLSALGVSLSFALSFFLAFDSIFLSGSLFLNTLKSGDKSEKDYTVLYNADGLMDLHDNKSGKDIYFYKKWIDHPVRASEGDTIILSFKKGLPGFNFDPQVFKIRENSSVLTAASVETVQPGMYDTTKLKEYFADSVHIARRGLNKIEVARYGNNDSNYVIIRFYSKQSNKWILRNRFWFEKDDIVGCDPQLSDFNNDGLKDLTYISAVAARGANEVRRLFIYDRNTDKLIYLKNSEEYPNMKYDKELNCVNAFMVYGGCMTVFLRIQGDSLKQFANVELGDGLTVTEIDKYGNEKVLLRDTAYKAGYVRFRNYNPLKED